MSDFILNKCHYQENDLITKTKSKRKAQQEAQGEVQKSMTVQSLLFLKIEKITYNFLVKKS